METFHWKSAFVVLMFVGCFALVLNGAGPADKKIEYVDVISNGSSAIGRGFDRKLHSGLGLHWKHIIVDGVKLDYHAEKKAFIVAKDQFYEGEVAEWDLTTTGEYPNFKYEAKIRYPDKQLEIDKRRRNESRRISPKL
jgi:hypothetical protein